jgi:hypothetical protein
MEGLDEAAGLRTCAFKIGIATAVLTSLFCYYTSLQNTPYQLAKQREVRSSAILSVAKTVECPVPVGSTAEMSTPSAPFERFRLRQLQAMPTSIHYENLDLQLPQLDFTSPDFEYPNLQPRHLLTEQSGFGCDRKYSYTEVHVALH